MTDKQLREDILDELVFEPSIVATHIGVVVENGVVTLSGHVSSNAEKLAAEKAVRRIKGVRAIAQEIEVRYAFEKKTADDQIAKRCLDILDWGTLIPQGKIQLTVHDGYVTMAGEVGWWYQRKAAEDSIRKLSGVAGVTNNISIKPHVQPSDVKQKIENALKRSAEVEAQGIKVSVMKGGDITLEGKVHNWRERSAVETAAWSAPGVNLVENHLTIA